MENEKNKDSKMSYDELENEYNKLKIKCDNLTLENNNLKRIIFGSKREKLPNTESINTEQCSLFDNEEDIEKNVQEQIIWLRGNIIN